MKVVDKLADEVDAELSDKAVSTVRALILGWNTLVEEVASEKELERTLEVDESFDNVLCRVFGVVDATSKEKQIKSELRTTWTMARSYNTLLLATRALKTRLRRRLSGIFGRSTG